MVGDELKHTATVYPGVNTLAGPEIIKELPDDLYRNLIYQWVTKDGITSDEAEANIDWSLDTYTFYGVDSVDGNIKYVAAPKDVRFNMTYMGHLAYYLYVPVVEGVTIDKLGAHYTPTKVLIEGKEYYCNNAGWINPQTAINDNAATITYTIEGQQYSVNYTLSALLYANIICDDYIDATDIEIDAIKKLIAYIEEIYEFTGVMTDADQAKFNTFFTDYNEGNRPAYITEYPESDIHAVNPDFVGLVQSFGVTIAPNNRIAFTTTLSANSVTSGYKISYSNFSSPSVKVNDDGTATYYTDNTGLVSTLMSRKFTIFILDADNKVVASTDYSLATYIKGIEGKAGEDVAKALYTFGMAVIEVRKTLY